jgi:hypothetical protein
MEIPFPSRRELLRAAIVGSGAVATQGCFGSFGLTRALHGFNAGFGGPILQWIVFVVMATILPVYEIGVFADIFIFNVLEFWTGSNPMAARGESSETELVLEDGTRLWMRRSSGDRMHVVARKDGRELAMTLQAHVDGLTVVSERGQLMGSASDDGERIEVRDAAGRIARVVKRDERAQAQALIERGELRTLVALAAKKSPVRAG